MKCQPIYSEYFLLIAIEYILENTIAHFTLNQRDDFQFGIIIPNISINI